MGPIPSEIITCVAGGGEGSLVDSILETMEERGLSLNEMQEIDIMLVAGSTYINGNGSE